MHRVSLIVVKRNREAAAVRRDSALVQRKQFRWDALEQLDQRNLVVEESGAVLLIADTGGKVAFSNKGAHAPGTLGIEGRQALKPIGALFQPQVHGAHQGAITKGAITKTVTE